MKKGTLIALGVFAALLVAVIATREKQVSVGVRKLAVARLDKEKVTGIELSGSKVASLQKGGDGWTVADPANAAKKFAAEQAQVEGAIDAINELKDPDFVNDRADKLAEYELDDGKALVVKAVQSGGPSVEFLVGKAAKNGGVYVRKPGSNEVFVARGRLEWSIRKDVKAWRKRAILSMKPEELASLTLRSKDGEAVTVVAGEKAGEWSLADGTSTPAGFRFDPQVAQQVADQLTRLSALDFLEGDAASDDKTGFGAAHDTVEAALKDGKKVVVHLGNDSAAKVDGDPQTYALAPYSANALRKKLADLRDLTMFSFAPEKVTKLKIQGGGKTVVLQRKDADWVVAEPKTLPAGFEFESSQVTNQLGMLRSMKAARWLETKVADGQAGFTSPSLLIEVTGEGGKVQTLRAGKDAPGASNGAKEIYARSSSDGMLYALPEGLRTRLAQGLDLFKKPPPAPAFGGPGGMHGLEQLPPEVRRQIEAQLRAQQH